jgi:putative transposase
MNHSFYQYWSKSSIYLKALRDNKIQYSLNTWYKYTNLLGFERGKSPFKKKYSSLVTTKPNEFWCADVTVFKTLDGCKHCIHILLNHYSKKVLEFQIMDRAIKYYYKRSTPKNVQQHTY